MLLLTSSQITPRGSHLKYPYDLLRSKKKMTYCPEDTGQIQFGLNSRQLQNNFMAIHNYFTFCQIGG